MSTILDKQNYVKDGFRFKTTDTAIKPKRCTCCGERTQGRQWSNLEPGYGICNNCIDWLVRDRRMTDEDMQDNYGTKGINYYIPIPATN